MSIRSSGKCCTRTSPHAFAMQLMAHGPKLGPNTVWTAVANTPLSTRRPQRNSLSGTRGTPNALCITSLALVVVGYLRGDGPAGVCLKALLSLLTFFFFFFFFFFFWLLLKLKLP